MLWFQCSPGVRFSDGPAKPGVPIGRGSMRAPKLLSKANSASPRSLIRWKPSLLGTTGRMLAVINFFLSATFVEWHLEVLGLHFAKANYSPFGIYFILTVGLCSMAASLLMLFAKTCPYLSAIHSLIIFILTLEPASSAYLDWSRMSTFHPSNLVPMAWLFLNMLQTWGLYARACRIPQGDRSSQPPISLKGDISSLETEEAGGDHARL